MKRIIIVLATGLQLLPHPFGLTPVGALAVYAGAQGRGSASGLVALLPLAAGLLVSGWYSMTVLLLVAAGLLASVLWSRCCLRQRRSPGRYLAAVFGGALLFYLLSNFGVWLAGYYPATHAGLWACYVAALPVLATALLADTVYSTLFFGLHQQLERSTALRGAPA